jgi:catechol 2,3-dioxygenase-like lactoylglutathione lyase family enzyme
MPGMGVASFHTVLRCRKWSECMAFYRDVLGLSIVDRKEGFVEFQVTSTSRIGLIDTGGRREEDEGGRDRIILSFCVDNLEAVHEELSSRWPGTSGIRTHPWGDRLFEVEDPEGRRIEFWTRERRRDHGEREKRQR